MGTKEAKYDIVGEFNQGIAIVVKNGKYGAIMVGGKEIVPPIYDALTEFTDGLAKVEYKGEERIVNLSGQIQVKKDNHLIFIPEKYEWGCDYSGGVCVVERDGKHGLLSDDLVELIEPFFDTIIKINNESYLAIGKQEGVLLNTKTLFRYDVKDCIISEKGIFEGAVVSRTETGKLLGIVNDKLELVQPLENESVDIKSNKFFVTQQKGKGVGICTVDGDIVPKGQYDKIEVLNENFIVTFNRDIDGWKIIHTSLLNEKGICLVDFSGYVPFSVSKDGSASFDRFKISPSGVFYYVSYKKINYKWAEQGQYIVTSDFIKYEYIEPFNSNQFIVGKVNEKGILRFGIVDSKAIVILPFEYSRLKKLSKDFIAYSIDEENILDLKKDYNDKDLEWLLYNTDYGRFGDKLYSLNYGIINSEFREICMPKYEHVKVIKTEIKTFFLVSERGWGIIDEQDKVLLPIKFEKIDIKDNELYNKQSNIHANHLEGTVSGVYSGGVFHMSLKNNFDERGFFVVSSPNDFINVSSFEYDWCENFNTIGWAKVLKDGFYGKINTNRQLVSLFDDTLIVVPDIYDWAYDFCFGYAPVYKDKRWGIADKNWVQVIPCVYESIEPIGEGFFKYKETVNTASCDDNKGNESIHNQNPQYVYGIVNIENVEIIKANYKDIWLLEEGCFKIERLVDNTVSESDRYGIINNNGDLLVPPYFSEIVLVNKKGIDFWIVSQNNEKGVYLNKDLIIPCVYHSIDFVGESIDCVLSNCGHRRTIKYNLNGEVVVNYLGATITIPQEYIIALESSIGLFRVMNNERKWGILNCKKEIVVPPRYGFIGEFEHGYAIVGDGDFTSFLNEKNELYRANVKYGIIDIKGEEVIPLENDDITLFDNGYIGFQKDGLWGLMSASLSLVIAPSFTSLYLFDNWHFVISNNNSEKGLIDCCGNTIIPLQHFDNIEISEDGYLKVTHNGYLQSRCKLYNAQGKVVLGDDDSYEEITYKGNGLNLVRKREWYDYRDDAYYHVYNLCAANGKEILPYFCKEIHFVEKGNLSIKGDKGWGIADIMGNIIIEPNYEEELKFENGTSKITVRGSSSIHKISLNGDVYIINGNKNIKLPKEFYWGTEFVNGLSIVRSLKEHDKVGIVNQKGKMIIPAVYDKISIMSNDCIFVVDGICLGIADMKGRFIFPPIFSYFKYLTEDRIWAKWNVKVAMSWCSNGSFVAGDGEYSKSHNYPRQFDRVALCDSNGNILNDKEIVYISKFENGYAKAYKDIFVDEKGIVRLTQAGIIDINGSIVLEPKYKRIDFHNESYVLAKDNHYSIFRLSDKKLTCFEGNDINHIWSINSFGMAEYTSTGKYISKESSWDGDRGVLGIDGIIVPAGKYDYVEILDKGMILVANKPIVFSYEQYIPLSIGFDDDDDDDYKIESRKKQWYEEWGVLLSDGKEIVPCCYSYIYNHPDNKIILCQGGNVSYNKYKGRIEVENGKWSVLDIYTHKVIETNTQEEAWKFEIKPKHTENQSINKERGSSVFENPKVLLTDCIEKRKNRVSDDYFQYDDDSDDGYNKYGGYNGWDDNTIDEAFDGNPELTWNID